MTHDATLERLAKDKHSNLFCPFVSDGENRFLILRPGFQTRSAGSSEKVSTIRLTQRKKERKKVRDKGRQIFVELFLSCTVPKAINSRGQFMNNFN